MTGEVGVGEGVGEAEAVAVEVDREEGRVAVAVAEAEPVGKGLCVGTELGMAAIVSLEVEEREVLEDTVLKGLVGLSVPADVLEEEGEGVDVPVAAKVLTPLPLEMGLREPL